MRVWPERVPRHCQHPLMPVGDDQVDLGGSSCSQVLQYTDSAIFALLGARSQGYYLFGAFQIHSQGR